MRLTTVLAVSLASLQCGSAAAQPPAFQQDPQPRRWIVSFDHPGAMQRLRSATPGSAADAQLFQALREQVVSEQDRQISALTELLGRSPSISHRFLLTHSGIALELLPEEAARISTLPGLRIELERSYPLQAAESMGFVGADAMWSGSWGSPALPVRGEGMIAGVLDSGLVLPHPAFNDDPACGHGDGKPPKVLSMVDCSSTDALGQCDGPLPADTNGHGSHVAAIMAGNRVGANASPPPPLLIGQQAVSGVAPCARLRIYKTCPGSACPQADLLAGFNQLLLDGDVDVMNFSIAGGTDPWADNDRIKLDLLDSGVLVVAAAGNTTATNTVNHRAPWLLSVASSTHAGQITVAVSAVAPDSPTIPDAARNIATARGSASPDAVPATELPLRRFAEQPEDFEGCTPGDNDVPADMPAFPAGHFNGAAALIRRGGCPDTVKINNAAAAGAELVLIRITQAGAPSLNSGGQAAIPAYAVGRDDGLALAAFVDQHPDAAAIEVDLRTGDVMSLISIRGPLPAPFANLTKPDLTAPGVAILAAGIGSGNSAWTRRTGTSMSSPHVAGAALLLRQLHPTWTLAETKSALMLAAQPLGLRPSHLPWTGDDAGSGRLAVAAAARAGLVMDESRANYLAADPATGGDLRTLNRATLRDIDCTPFCRWTRRLRNTLPGPSSWQASVETDAAGFQIEVSPAQFSFTGIGVPPAPDSLFHGTFEAPGEPETVLLQITARPTVNLSSATAFGRVRLEEQAGRSPALSMGVAIRGRGDLAVIDLDPQRLDFVAPASSGVQSAALQIGNLGFADLVWTLAEEPARQPLVLDLGTQDEPLDSNRNAPLNLQLDDGTTENAIGAGITPFLWLNRFTPQPEAFPITLDRVQVFFNTTIQIGNRFDVVLYADADGDPANGADFVAQVTNIAVSQVGEFMDIELPESVVFDGPGDILVAIVTRTGMAANNRLPAALDQTPPRRQRSWIGLGDLASPPVLPLETFGEIGQFAPPGGNWLLRASGTSSLPVPECSQLADVPWLQVSEDSGVVPAASSQAVLVSVDPTGLPAGLHRARLCIQSNDDSQPLSIVPVELSIGPSGGG